MAVDTAKVRGRRQVGFASFDELLADAEALAASPGTRTLGNWPLARLLAHLAVAINGSIDGISLWVPWYARLLGFFLKGRILKKGVPAGFKLPKEREAEAYPPAASLREALDMLRRAVARTRAERMTARHPLFGRLTHEEWTRLHLNHAAMHLSFAVPGG